jgi:hypothetical protein
MASRAYRVLDDVAMGVSAEAALPNRVTVMWCVTGTANVSHLGDVICSLDAAVSARKVCDGLPAGQTLTITATSNDCVFEWIG